MFTSVNLRQMLDAGLNGEQALVLMFLNEQSEGCDGELRTATMPVSQLASSLGRSPFQIKRAIAGLVRAGAVVRRQVAKAKGETAWTVLTDRGLAWVGRAGETGIPADLPAELRQLLALEGSMFVSAVVEAWRAREPLDPSLREECRAGRQNYERLEAYLREKMLDAAEAMATACAEERADQAKVEAGIVTFDCDDGAVDIDVAAFKSSKGTIATVDLVWCRDVLRRVRQFKPGFVTVNRLPELVAEVGYSRVVGFVARHDAEQAHRALVATMTRGAWSRPKGIRDTFYAAANGAARFSTAVRASVH